MESIITAIMILLVVLCTILTFDRWLTAILSVGGLALYVASWPAESVWGSWPAMLVWAVGILMWFTAVRMCMSSTD